MPSAAPKPCCHPGCGVLVRDGTAWCPAHPRSQGFADRSRGTRQERGYGAEWERLRKIVLRRDKGLCQVCLAEKRIGRAYAVDHIKPKSQGGTDDLDNLQGICKAHHATKTAREGGGRAV
ncbi:MAG: HNH endonuclease [Candidatus Saccharibacteria bacterium]|nr:HNH endonuclease [Rhodoferax sp.]